MRHVLNTLILMLFAVVAVQAANSPVYHSPTTGNNYIAYDLLKTGADAEAYCLARSGHLAVINNHAEATELFNDMSLLLQGGPVTEDITNYTIGEYITENATVEKTVTTQGFYTDPAYTYGSYYNG
uniref:C-type lectin domain-containing protein n=1 Tax=Flavobacterium sp. TaxID=239 RepID=UPI002625B420